jgi:hypothetical protein
MEETSMEEATRKIIEDHIQSATICMVTVDIMQWSLKPEDLSRQWVDGEGNVWFTFFDNDVDSKSFTEGHMEVFYSNVTQSKFMSLVGYAVHADHVDRLDETHPAYPAINLNSDNLPFRLLKFIPESAYYWDNQKEDMVSLRLRKLHWDDRYKFQLVNNGPSRP